MVRQVIRHFAAMFPHLAETFTVATGGGVGQHVYLFADELPDTVRAMKTPIGHLELRASGCQIVAPPSIHPDTGQPYTIEKALDISACTGPGRSGRLD